MFNLFKKNSSINTVTLNTENLSQETCSSELLSVNRPVVITGTDLIDKLKERLTSIKENTRQIENMLRTEYVNSIEGSAKADKRRELQKSLHDLKVRELWLLRLQKVVSADNRYSMTLVEAISLGVIEDVIIE